MRNPEITLTALEIAECDKDAAVRDDAAIMLRQSDRLPEIGRVNPNHRKLGAYGEMVVSKYFGVPYVPNGGRPDKETKDVCGMYQVRTAGSEYGNLLAHKSDNDNDIFILVVRIDTFRFRLSGWAYGREIKKDEYWIELKKGMWRYLLPKWKLRSMDTIPEKDNARSYESFSI